MADGSSAAAPEETGLVGAAKGVFSTVVAAVETRLEILGTEIQEERIRLTRMVLLATAGLFCLFLGVALLAMYVVVLYWDTNRLGVLGIMTGVFLTAGAGSVVALALLARGPKPPPLAQTLDVLAKDRERLESSK